MPRQAAHRRHRLELVDHVARDEVDVVVAEADAGVADALSPQLVEFGVVHPLHALRRQRSSSVSGPEVNTMTPPQTDCQLTPRHYQDWRVLR